MRPPEARCHLGLGAVLDRGRGATEARAHVARSAQIFADLGIARWCREADALSIDVVD